MSDKRKRLNSSMTYDEFVDFYQASPQTPTIRPLKESPLLIPELKLSFETPTTQKKTPLQTIPEDDRFDQLQIPTAVKHIKKRQRFQSENVQYTVMNMIERSIQRKKSLKALMESERY